ncbi:MAG TPA: tetratricopeptide repeat protein [Bacteroidales bacterium]|nr:tetratricopeptide repeat protein [Bacteroidales bacterium]
MMKRLVLLTWLLTTLINSDLISQSKTEIKKNFYEAESWILFEDYKEALPLYQQLLRIFPTNSNFKYRIGQCYINTPGEKEKAVTYLEDAIKDINPKYKEGKFREAGAPFDAFYYLANAYRINNQLDKALETYEIFRKNLDPTVYDTTIVNLQIQSCLNAKELIKMPLFIKEKNLGSVINESNSEFNPVISDNEDLLIYSKSEAFYDAILYSLRINGEWSGPLNMNELLRVDRDLFPTSISNDSKDLYLYSSADYDGIIYSSTFENGIWTPLIKLNENINTKFWESHATISHDNKKLYFTSNRKGTLGGLDIYVSQKDSINNWGPAVNLGPVINTPYNEESPFLSRDDKTLFFSSRGHFNMGGYDIFYSTLLDNGQWSVPLNVGYPLNSTDDDVFFKPLNQGYEGYYAKDSPEGFGKQDIYRIEIFSDDHPRKFFVRGMVKVADLRSSIKDSVKISAMNIKNPNQLLVVYSNPETGEYEFQLPQGNYEVTFESDGSEKIVKNLDLPLENPSDSFVLPGTILPKTDFVADLIIESNKTISVVKGDTIMFPIKAEANSLLTVEHWVSDSLVSVEQFILSDSTFNYKMVPSTGDNKVVFKLTDKFSNSTTTDVFITREKDVIKQPLIRPEYSRVIAKKQIAALTAVLKSRASDKLKKVIEDAHIDKQQFGKVDDLISYLKEEAALKSIRPDELDKLALKIAAMDNILTQAAVNLMAKNTDGDLKKILDGLDIYKSNLKTWTDLQEFLSAKSGLNISPIELNKIAADVLTDVDPSISIIRDKILTYSESSENGSIIRQSVAAVDISNIKLAEKWLQAFINESLKLGLSHYQMADMLAIIGTLPDTKTEQFLSDLIKQTEEPLLSYLKSIDLKKEKIKTAKDLFRFLLTENDKEKFPEEALYKSIANLISTEDIPDDIITSQLEPGKENSLWFLWILLGTGLLSLFIILWKRNKKKKN